MPEWMLARISRSRVLRKCLGRPFLFVSERVWNRLPASVTTTRPMRCYGVLLHSLVQLRSKRGQSHGTFFLRNRPELRLICALLNQKANGSIVRLTVLACSNGAEVYSILWAARSARPDMEITTHALDISPAILEVAKPGRYSLIHHELVETRMFERLTEEEMEAMFDRDKDQVVVKPWIREGIDWRVADAGNPELAKLLGPQDIVVANRFLCHMDPTCAEKCLRSISKLVAPGGYLFVSGVDLNVRTKVARELGWAPVSDFIEEIHNGDPSVRNGWPWNYWGLEPFTRRRLDWQVRYASVFRVGSRALMSMPRLGVECETA